MVKIALMFAANGDRNAKVLTTTVQKAVMRVMHL